MRLVELRLHDLRRFADLGLDLAPGINLLSGPNGAGKSTLIEAVGFALFGALPARAGGESSAAVRDGETELRVEATFEHDGERYTVVRTLSASKQTAKLREAARTKPIASEPRAVADHLARLLKLSTPDALEVVFRRLVGIEQGEITRPFLLPPQARAEYFGPLLNLDRYEIAARGAAAVGQRLRTEVLRVQTEQAQTKGEMKGYQSMVERRDRLATETDAARARASGLGDRLRTLAAEAETLDGARTRLQTLTVDAAVLAESLRGRASELKLARVRLDEAEAARGIVDNDQKAFERFELLETECRALELRRTEYDDLRAEVESLDRRLVEGRKRMESARDELHGRLEANEGRATELMGRRDLLRENLDILRTGLRQTEGTHNALTLALARADRLHKPIAGIPVPVKREGADGDDEAARREREARAAEMAAVAAASEALTAEMDALRARAATHADARTRLSTARATLRDLEAAKADLDQILAALQPAHGACPYLKAPCSNIGGKSLIDHHAGEAERLQTAIATARDGIRFAEARAAEALEARRELERKEAEVQAAAARRSTGARKAATPQPAGPSATPGGRHRLDFNELAHHLSGLAGVLGAIEPPTTTNEPFALIGAVAGEGDTTPRSPVRIELPDVNEIELASSLAHKGRQVIEAPASAERDQRAHALSTELAGLARRIHASVVRAEAQARVHITRYREQARASEESLQESSRELERLTLDRARIRAETKRLSSDDLELLDVDIALSDRRMRLGTLDRLEAELGSKRNEQESLRQGHDEYQAHSLLASRVDDYRREFQRLEGEQADTAKRAATVKASLASARAAFDEKALARVAREREKTFSELGEAKESVRSLEREKLLLGERLEELAEVAKRMDELEAGRVQAEAGSTIADDLAATYRAMAGPIAEAIVGQVTREANRLYRMVTRRHGRLALDAGFALTLVEATGARPFSELARGEQVTAALAVLLALLEQFPDVGLLLLDEPTAHLDDDRRHGLAAALAAYRRASAGYLHQVVVVSHDDAFDQVAEHHVRLA